MEESPLKTLTSAGMETADQTVARAKSMLSGTDYLSNLPVAATKFQAPTFPDPIAPDNLSYEGILSSADSYLQSANNKVSGLETNQTAIDSRIKSLMGSTAGRGQAILDAEDAAGLDKQQGYLNDLNRTILDKTNALRKAQIADEYSVQMLEGRGGIPLGIVRGQQARLEKQQLMRRNVDAANLANMVAVSDLLQGNITGARESIERKINLKYDDAEKALENEMFFYQQNWDRLSAAQQAQATERMNVLNAQRDVLNQRKEDERMIFDLQAGAAQAGADQATIAAIGNAGSKEAAAELAYGYIGRQAGIDRDLSRTDTRLSIASKQKALNEADGTFKFSASDRAALASSLSTEQIKTLETKIQEKGMDRAMQELADTNPVYRDIELENTIGTIFGLNAPVSDADIERGREAVRNLIKVPTTDEAETLSNNTDFDKWYDFDAGASAYISKQTSKQKDYISLYEAQIAAGKTPEEALDAVMEAAYK